MLTTTSTHSKIFSSSEKETPYPLAVTPHPLPQALANADSLSVSIDLLNLDISWKWSQMTFGLLWLASFPQHVLKLQPCYSMYQTSFLFLPSNTPSYGCSPYCLYIHQLVSILVVSEWETSQVQKFNIYLQAKHGARHVVGRERFKHTQENKDPLLQELTYYQLHLPLILITFWGTGCYDFNI